VVARAAVTAHKTAAYSLDQFFIRHFKVEDNIYRLVDLIKDGCKSISLGYSPWISVKDEAFFTVLFLQTVLNNPYKHLIRNKFSFIHICLGCKPKLGPFPNIRPQNIPCGDLRDSVEINHFFGLGTFSGTRGPEDYYIHSKIPVSVSFSLLLYT